MALTDNLVAVWELDEASGDALDSYGSNDLTETSGTIGAASGPSGLAGARDFEFGDSEYFTRADNTDLSTGDIDFTLAIWLYAESLPGDQVCPLIKGGASDADYYIQHNGGASRLDWFVYSAGGFGGGTSVRANTFGALSTATWYHVVVWHDSAANQIGIAINGGAADTSSHSAGVRDGADAFTIGSYPAFNQHWDGLIAQAALWKRVLTSDERTDLYAAGAGLPYSSWGGGAPAGPAAYVRTYPQAVRHAASY